MAAKLNQIDCWLKEEMKNRQFSLTLNWLIRNGRGTREWRMGVRIDDLVEFRQFNESEKDLNRRPGHSVTGGGINQTCRSASANWWQVKCDHPIRLSNWLKCCPREISIIRFREQEKWERKTTSSTSATVTVNLQGIIAMGWHCSGK